MAAGGPASELIMFIVAVIIAGSVAGALAYVTNDLANSMKVRGAMVAEDLKIEFAIINDPNAVVVTGTGPYNYTFYVKNIGKIAFPFSPDSVQVFIDGDLVPSSNLTFTDTAGNPITSLQPFQVGVITVTLGTALDTTVPHRIQIVLENGKRRVLVFRIKS
ncbi:flagellar protein G [Thermococcus chitonophagus]|uniref:Flagella-related protein FlaG n=1 Tax=Thermococcus chitonophagus TaxID=54262 RepID=A0A160VSN4_9EURY|nr:flagellar protein G [Thermococcus chitonophagus]ASJ17476.1 flagellar protein G [Thermococcus chitonophagus]CUX78123.1 Flagella-related protein FlaG [Thermococcus chitonophagus]